MTGHPSALPLKTDVRLVYWLSLALAGLLAAAAVTGLLYGMRGLYEPYPASQPGIIGQDIVMLAGGVPLLLVSMWLTRRGSLVGIFLWAGTLFYAAYTYYFMAVGAFNALFPIYVAIVALGTYGLLALLFRVDTQTLARRLSDTAPRRATAGFFFVIVGLFTLTWGGLVVSTVAQGAELNPVQHLVVAIDGAILLPVLFYAGVQLWRGAASGILLGGMLLVKSAATGLTLAFTGAFAMWWNRAFDPFEAFLIVIFGTMTISAVVLLLLYPRSVGRPG
ncbi:MAG: hypothetical protein ACRDG7_05675 [Candidatus Limnocylindria bacterium]